MRPRSYSPVLCAALLAACGTTEVFYGDTPGVGRVVAGVLDSRTLVRSADGPAVDVQLNLPGAVAAEPGGGFWFTDRALRSVGHVTAEGELSWVVGIGPACTNPGPSPSGDPARACLGDPVGLVRAADGSLYVSDHAGHRVYRYMPADSTLTVVLGTGAATRAADGAAAATSAVFGPYGLWVLDDGTLYVVERRGHRLLRVDPAGDVHVVAGTGDQGDGGDGADPRDAQLNFPEGVASVGGTVYLADAGNHRIRRITDGVIAPYAGIGVAGLRGDGAGVAEALFRRPSTLAVAGQLLFVVDRGNNRIRVIRLGADSVSTFAGTGSAGPGLDGAEIARTAIGGPQGVAVLDRTVFIADSGSAVVRRVIR